MSARRTAGAVQQAPPVAPRCRGRPGLDHIQVSAAPTGAETETGQSAQGPWPTDAASADRLPTAKTGPREWCCFLARGTPGIGERKAKKSLTDSGGPLPRC
jgi:hypothetical protein